MPRASKLLLVELNEYNEELLREYTHKLHLPHLSQLLRLHRTETLTNDTYESDYLEPWVQWVSAHTGLPSSRHGIRHLGDTPHLRTPQIWEILSRNGISVGIWGAMNASYGSSSHCDFFLPDPWTAGEKAHPPELHKLLDFLRYTSTNYLNLSISKITTLSLSLLHFFSGHRLLGPFIGRLPSFIRALIRFHGEPFTSISLLDYLSALLFLQYRKKYRPDFSLIFLNSLAHFQHHHWNPREKNSLEKFRYVLTYLDHIFGHIFADLRDGETLLITNALSQKNTLQEPPWILYRQKDHQLFLKSIGILNAHVEPHMTHDAHLFFKNSTETRKAHELLASVTIRDQPLFHMESYPEEPCKLFYKIIFTNKADAEDLVKTPFQQYPFGKFFKPIVQRTGKHIPQGLLLSNDHSLPSRIFNHDLFKIVTEKYFNIQYTGDK